MADGWSGNQRAFYIGAYADPYEPRWEAYTGAYMAVGTTLKVLYLTNNASWNASNVRDPQGYINSWVDAAINFRVDGGRHASGATVYAHLRLAPWLTQSDVAHSSYTARLTWLSQRPQCSMTSIEPTRTRWRMETGVATFLAAAAPPAR
jgi:hypothetical protein